MHAAAMLVILASASPALAQDAQPQTQSLMDFVRAGGIVGYLIILLSIASVALVIDMVLRLKHERLLPQAVVKHALDLAAAGHVNELVAMSKASDSMFGRIVGGALDRARFGFDAVRQEMQQLGEAEILRLRYRVGYIGVVATAAPMLGLLGTVIGMINSFGVLGHARNAARPDELAVGISVALVTTCMGLILAVPLIFVHAYLRDRVSAVAQEAAHMSETLLGLLASSPANRPRPPVVPPAAATQRMPSAAAAPGTAPAGTAGAFAPVSPNPGS